MPSLFSRSRTTSAPKQPSPSLLSPQAIDEFGRVSSRNSATTSAKDKKKAKHEKRPNNTSTPRDRVELPEVPVIPEGAFLPLNLEKPRPSDSAAGRKEVDYGYLCHERHVVLGIEQVDRLVDVLVDELTSRGGVTTPFIFSSLALDINSPSIRKLIHAFLGTCTIHYGHGADHAEARWKEEARFAGLHELGMMLRWGLAKVVRSVGGQDVRGLISWDVYKEFHDSEAALNYPPAHLATMMTNLSPPLRSIMLRVLTLLSRLTANSASSGHTPPSLSPLFGPLIFGLGPATLSFHQTYIQYLRAVNAMEHIILAFIRWQDAPRSTANEMNGSASALGVPARLKDWIRGYPSMLPSLNDKRGGKPQARRGARTVRVLNVKRNVRMYSRDLVKTAASWANKSQRDGVASSAGQGLAGSKEWERIAPSALKLSPRYSENYKKRMDMSTNFHPDTGVPSPSTASTTPSYSSSTKSSLDDLLGPREGEDRFRSLTDLKWGEFELMGFGGLGIDDNDKLKFDLTESARSARQAKRTTLSWNDFSNAGFSRMDEPLKATLEFSTPVTTTISTWPSQNVEITRKLKKTQKGLPVFGWDTEPVLAGEEVIEEAFVDVFCDLIYGGGWMDLERDEEHDRECNWALIEFKSMPANRGTMSGSGSDPRTSTSLLLFEEFVPLEYRQQLALPRSNRRRLPSIFPSKQKQWKPATTLNGKPYVPGSVPHTPISKEAEFEGMLRTSAGTKHISLDSTRRSATSPIPLGSAPYTPTSSRHPFPSSPSPLPLPRISSPLYLGSRSDSPALSNFSRSETPTKKAALFKLHATISSPGIGRRAGMPPAEYSRIEFETRLASYSDDDNDGDTKRNRRMSKDDAWVDILVGSQSRRTSGYEARRSLQSRRSDPELASKEVAQALAAVRGRPLSFNSDDGMEPVNESVIIDEVQRIPRRPKDTVVDRLAYDDLHPSQDDASMDDDEDSDPNSPMAKLRQIRQQRAQMGNYFAKHPDRRPGSEFEDPRSRFSANDSGDEDDDILPRDITPAQTAPKPIRALPLTPDSIRPLPQPKPNTSVPPAKSQDAQKKPQGDQVPNPGSKTASLIAKYREMEASNTSPSRTPPLQSPQPSRLPIRNGLPSTPAPAKPAAPAANTTATATATPPPPIQTDLEPPPPVQDYDMSGRDSPGRYIHGAPLHNVLEEEEEEE